jgi:hypothetical protein
MKYEDQKSAEIQQMRAAVFAGGGRAVTQRAESSDLLGFAWRLEFDSKNKLRVGGSALRIK